MASQLLYPKQVFIVVDRQVGLSSQFSVSVFTEGDPRLE